jgi:hypothetical protein
VDEVAYGYWNITEDGGHKRRDSLHVRLQLSELGNSDYYRLRSVCQLSSLSQGGLLILIVRRDSRPSKRYGISRTAEGEMFSSEDAAK